MSEQETFHIETLIAKYISGECDATEEQQIKDWRSLSSENEKYVADALVIFERAKLATDQEFDTQAAWGNVSNRIKSKPNGRSIFFSPWKIAAGIILISALSFLFYQLIGNEQELNFRSNAEVQTQVLPDKTTLALNRETETKVTYNERQKTGLIELKGEALINIPEDKKVNWVVKVDELLIEDIGTVFNVKAYPQSNQVEVSVVSGEVRLFVGNQMGIRLRANEKGVYHKETGQFQIAVANQNVTAYQTRTFTYQNQDLLTVITQLSEVYAKEILLEGDIGNCRLTVNFDEEELDEILSIISVTLGLELSESGNQIILSGEGCF